MSCTVIKVGSSIVAEDDGTLRASTIARIGAEAAGLRARGEDVVIVTSGAIARGMHALGLPIRPREIQALQAASAVGQGNLYQSYHEALAPHGVRSAQVLLTFFDVSARMHYLNARRTLRQLLDWQIVPVINENDTTTTDEISFGDNDFLAAQVSILIGADLLILLTSTDGLFTADPARDPAARRIEHVSSAADLEGLQIGHHTSPLGAGGMRSKVVAAEMATAAGIETVIASGFQPGAIEQAAAGQRIGTRFEPHAVRQSSFKLWLRYAKPTAGVIGVDAGAVRALRDRGTSLLPVGIVSIDGAFDAGDAVEVRERDSGDLIGKGICNYAAHELRAVMGLQSQAVRERAPDGPEEAVHRDYFVLG